MLSNSSSSPKLLKRHDGVRLDFPEVMPGMSWLDEGVNAARSSGTSHLCGVLVEEHPLTAPAGLRCPVERAEAEGEPMQEKKIWTLVALAMLTALALVRPERALDGRVGGRGTSRSVPTSSEKGAIVSDRLAVSAFPPHAGSAWLLFRADWGAVLWRAYQKMNENRLLAVAAGVVFYGLLAVFPALTAFVSLYGLMADPSTIHERLSLATGILPQGALNVLD